MSPLSHKAAAVGIGTLARSCSSSTSSRSNINISSSSSSSAKGSTSLGVESGSASNASEAPAAAATAVAVAVADKARWADLETWLNCSLSTLEACTRCVNWTSAVGYVGALAYVRLFTLVLRLLCPVSGKKTVGGVTVDGADANRLFGGLRGGEGTGAGAGAGGAMGGERAIDDDGAGGEEGNGRLSWARDRLAQVVDDLMWRLREGLPGRDIRLRLLQVWF